MMNVEKVIGPVILIFGFYLLINAIKRGKYLKPKLMDQLRNYGLAVTVILLGLFMLLISFKK